MCEAEGIELACDLLTGFAHWITPEFMPKRFDTKFYVAEAPADHLAIHDGSESVDSVWINPGQVLKEADEGKWTVIFPTRCNLELLAESDSVNAAIEASNARPPCPILPTVEKRDDGNYLCIPKESPYNVESVKMEKGEGALVGTVPLKCEENRTGANRNERQDRIVLARRLPGDAQ